MGSERDIDPDYVLKFAKYVDSQMRSVADENPHMTGRASFAVFTALKIAAECHRLKAKLDGEEKETSCEEATTEEADPSDSLVGEVDQPGKPFTEEDKQRTRERRQRHHTRRWYERQLLAVAEGRLVMPDKEYKALLALGRVRGYQRRPTGKR